MCSNLYANGELAATPYETDKVLRHRKSFVQRSSGGSCRRSRGSFSRKAHSAPCKACDEGASDAD